MRNIELHPITQGLSGVQKVADNIHDVDEFGDLPQALLNRFSQILSRRRVMTTRTLDLFLRPDLDTVSIYDCASGYKDNVTKV